MPLHQQTTPGRLPEVEDVGVSAYSPRQPEVPSFMNWPTTPQVVGAAQARGFPKTADAAVPARDAQASSSEPSVPRAQPDFRQPGGAGQAVLPSQSFQPIMDYGASTPVAFNHVNQLAGQVGTAGDQAKVVAIPSVTIQEAPRFRYISYSISNSVRSLKIAGHGGQNFPQLSRSF